MAHLRRLGHVRSRDAIGGIADIQEAAGSLYEYTGKTETLMSVIDLLLALPRYQIMPPLTNESLLQTQQQLSSKSNSEADPQCSRPRGNPTPHQTAKAAPFLAAASQVSRRRRVSIAPPPITAIQRRRGRLARAHRPATPPDRRSIAVMMFPPAHMILSHSHVTL